MTKYQEFRIEQIKKTINPNNIDTIPSSFFKDPSIFLLSHVSDEELDFILSLSEEEWIKIGERCANGMMDELTYLIHDKYQDEIEEFNSPKNVRNRKLGLLLT
jgi:hypothetical protein